MAGVIAGGILEKPIEYDFTVDIWTKGSSYKYRASYIKGTYKNIQNKDGHIVVLVNNHALSIGVLSAEIIQYLPSEVMPDGSLKTYSYIDNIGVEIVRENVNTPDELNALAFFSYIKGEPFRFEDFTEEQIASFRQPAVDAAATAAEATEECTTATSAAVLATEEATTQASRASRSADACEKALITARAILPVFVTEAEYDALVNEGAVLENVTYMIYEEE